MSTRNFALIGGIIMLAMGSLALIPSLNSAIETLPVLNINNSYGLFLNLFPMNIFNKVILIVFGVVGIICYFVKESSNSYSLYYSKVVFWVFATLTILGLFPQTHTLSGYWPLFGYDIIVHGTGALVGGYFGYLSIREDIHQQRPQGLHKV